MSLLVKGNIWQMINLITGPSLSVRQKTKELIDFIQDDDRLRDDRKKAKKNKDKYIGMSNEVTGFSRGFSK